MGRDDVRKRPGDAEGEFTKWLKGWALKSEASRTIRSWSKTQSKNKVSVIQEDTSGIEGGMMKRMGITPMDKPRGARPSQKGLWSKTRIIRVAILV